MGKKSWIIKITLVSIVTSMVFTLVSTEVLAGAGYIAAFAVLIFFVALGVVFDVIGVAVTAAILAPFHSMAAHHERGATEAISLIKNADKVSSVCNDIVGDISGIVSGSMAALVAARIAIGSSTNVLIMQLIISGAVTGLMIGGKAFGKNFAINNTNKIILRIGKLLSLFKKS